MHRSAIRSEDMFLGSARGIDEEHGRKMSTNRTVAKTRRRRGRNATLNRSRGGVVLSTTEIEHASREWRAALIDVGGNNRLLYFKPNASTIDLASAAPAAISKLLGGASVRLTELFKGPEAVTAKRAVSALARKQREAMEEYGVAVAFLAAGLATWNPDANAAISAAEADELDAPQDRQSGSRLSPARPSAPVLLRAVELTKRRGAQESWELRLSEDFQLNDVLEHVMNADRVRLGEDEVLDKYDGTADGVESVLKAVQSACADVSEFAVEEALFLGAFSYLKQPMVADVDNIEALAKSKLVAALAGDPEAVASVRAVAQEITESQPDYAPVDSEYLVLDADASQSYVVNAAVAGRSLVVEGPPGTGKSQTIANVIASSVAAGKKVLFVAQKRAAITAVLDRLETVSLSHLVLDTFASVSSRRFVAESLREALDRQMASGIPRVEALHHELSGARNRLVSHRDELFSRVHGWGISIAELRSSALGLPQQAFTSVRLPSGTFSNWAATSLDAHAAALEELHNLGALSPEWRTRAGWSPDAITSSKIAADYTDWILTVANASLPTALKSLAHAAATAGLPMPAGWEDVDRLVGYLDRVGMLAETAPGFLDAQVEQADLVGMLVAIDREYRKSSALSPTWGERRKAKKRAKALAPALTSQERAVTLRELLTLWDTSPQTPRAPDDYASSRKFWTDLRDGLSSVQRAVQGIDLTSLAFEALSETLSQLAVQREKNLMPRAHELEVNLDNAGLSRVVETLRNMAEHERIGVGPGDLLRWIVIHSLLEDAITRSPTLAALNGRDLDAATATFAAADTSHLNANSARVRRLAAEALKQALDAHPEQHAVLKTEITRKRNFKTVRRLFEEARDVVLSAKPVWAMSPLQVSRMLPSESCFDVVIFDEASQIKPSDAIPALLRAQQAVIAGDSRQLPPTEFFSKLLDDVPPVGSDELEGSDELVPLDTGAPMENNTKHAESFTKDAESILFAMDRVLAGQSRMLHWHYRSQDERLIAVSNAHVYDHSLTTFPAADLADSIQHVAVPPSKGLRDGTNSPEAEVAEVIKLIRAHFAKNPGESLGVITFGVAHQRRIEAALDAAASSDAELADFITRRKEEAFFVKSIERVQGDERDAIILTVGYGKGLDGKLRYFWGPLLQEGGERRLNVAISRAKRRMTLVTSFTADDVPEDGHHSAGFKLMYRFLRFMSSGGTELAGGADWSHPLNAFEIDVRDRLSAAGIQLDPQVGVGSYRIDFAARHPEFPGLHVLAIEADGASYHSGHTARERDRLRQSLLERRGWVFHRIWSTDWFNDAHAEVARAVAAYQDAIDTHNSRASKRAVETRESSSPSSTWHVASPVRTVPRPPLRPGRPIADYSLRELVGLIRYIRSDGVLRSAEDEVQVAMVELGFQKRGSRIVKAIQTAQQLADRSDER